MPDSAVLDDLALLDAESGLHSLYDLHKAADGDTTHIEKAHATLTAEMRARSLFYEPLAKIKDDGIHTPGGTKRGKGGHANEVQDKAHPDEDVDGDTDDENDGTLGYIKKTVIVNDETEYAVAKAMGDTTPHVFNPVINVCKTCRQHGTVHGDADHDFVPVRNVCRTCKMGQEGHLSKAIGEDQSIYKGLRQFSPQDKQVMAENGVALPDGSFPIPDEAHLHTCIGLLPQAPDPQTAMNHIIERAKAMGMEHALPEAWNVPLSPTNGPPVAGVGAHSMGDGAMPSPAQAGAVKPFDPAASAPAGGPGAKPGGPPGAGGAAPGAAPGSMSGPAAGARTSDLPPDPLGGTGGAPGAGGTGDILDPTKKPPLMKRLGAAIASAVKGGTPLEDAITKAIELELDPEFEYAMIKTVTEDRYTLGPVYMPGMEDAHGEWASAEDLRKSAHDYVAETGADRTVFLQHSTTPAGKWVDMVAWPTEVQATMQKSIDGVTKAVTTTLPAGTVYMGVEWEPWAFEKVKRGEITGFSMGGWAKRVEAAIPR